MRKNKCCAFCASAHSILLRQTGPLALDEEDGKMGSSVERLPAHDAGASATEAQRFTLDTSGSVAVLNAAGVETHRLFWGNLTPFQQGYVEAALRWFFEKSGTLKGGPPFTPLGFSDLAPATLAAMLRDCDARVRQFHADTAEQGAVFFRERQKGNRQQYGFPPVTLYLGDDGLIYQRETAQ